MNGLFRLLFPSWAFFDQPGHVAQIEWRQSEEHHWLPWPEKITRKWYHLFFHPMGNWNLYLQQLAQQMLIDSQNEKIEFAQQNSYKKIIHFLSQQQPESASLQFRLIAAEWKSQKEEVIFTQTIYPRLLK